MTPQQALARLQGQCGRSEQCSGQVRRKLQRWSDAQVMKGLAGFTQGQMDEIIASLVRDKFVDDARFAGAYVRDKAKFAGWGAVKIACQLKALGVVASVVQQALADNQDVFNNGSLEKLLQKKWDSLKKDLSMQQKREKVLRFAVSRGFGYGQIMDIIKNFK